MSVSDDTGVPAPAEPRPTLVWPESVAPRRARPRPALAYLAVLLGAVVLAAAVLAHALDRPPEAAVIPQTASSAVATAASLSRLAYPAGAADNVVLTADVPSGDALVAGGLQGLFGAPLLLTDPSALSPETEAEIRRLGAPNIHTLGGELSVSPAVEQQLAAAGHMVHRHAGPTRVETAVSVAELHFPTATEAVFTAVEGAGQAETQAPVVSLAAGVLAAHGQVPLLFTEAQALSPGTEQYLRRSAIRRAVVVGDAAQVAEAVLARLAAIGIQATRVAGADHAATAVAVAGQVGFPSAADAGAIVMVDGSPSGVWPGGYVAPLFATRWGGPVLYSQEDGLPEATRAYLAISPLGPGPVLLCMPGVREPACNAGRALLTGM
jgi:putative cell wall-binding protein